jgi:hypothetical protein
MAWTFAMIALEATSIFPERKMRTRAMTKLIKTMLLMICKVLDGSLKVEAVKTTDHTQEIVTSEGIFGSNR